MASSDLLLDDVKMQFWIDVGGTFTDCFALAPDGELRRCKVLSSGVTKGAITSVSEVAVSDSRRAGDPDQFWVGYQFTLAKAQHDGR